MKCKCSLNNNYQVIGLCDIAKFNSKISGFTDNSWTQLTMPEKFDLPPNKPPIKTITKIYLDIKISSTKIIKTPSSNIPNIQGLSLTGKILLVSGCICQSILYTSKDLNNSMHCVKFNSPFSTYIVIEENVDIDNDKYYVYPCVEDIHVTALNEQIISKSVTLFLFAHKTTKTLIYNTFIFKTSDTNNEMAKIEFDGDTKKLIVTSTGENYNDATAASKDVFIFRITNLTTGSFSRSTIEGTGDATNFKTQLNDIAFSFGDVIALVFKNNSKVSLTNYPIFGTDYSMIGKNFQSFKVTTNGIVPYILPNDIILNGSNNQPVITVQFDILTKSLLIYSTGNTTSAGGQNYFKITILKSDGKAEKFTSSIAGDSTGANFKNALNNQAFEFNDLLSLNYEDNSKVIVTNFPTSNTPRYNPKGNSELFKITQNGLIAIQTNIPNTFKFKTSDTDYEMAKIAFDVTSKKLVVTSTGRSYNEPLATSTDVFIFRIANLFTGIFTRSTIKGNGNANTFQSDLNGKYFEFGDIITLTFRDSPKVLLTNYPTLGHDYSMISKSLQSFQITPNGIVPYILPNEIILNGANNQPVVIVQFDILARQILVTSTGNVTASTGTQNYFKMTFLQADGTTQIIASVISINSNGTIFRDTLNSQLLVFNGVIKLEYEDKNQVVITNFPNSSTPIYNPSGISEKFKITQNALIKIL